MTDNLKLTKIVINLEKVLIECQGISMEDDMIKYFAFMGALDGCQRALKFFRDAVANNPGSGDEIMALPDVVKLLELGKYANKIG